MYRLTLVKVWSNNFFIISGQTFIRLWSNYSNNGKTRVKLFKLFFWIFKMSGQNLVKLFKLWSNLSTCGQTIQIMVKLGSNCLNYFFDFFWNFKISGQNLVKLVKLWSKYSNCGKTRVKLFKLFFLIF